MDWNWDSALFGAIGGVVAAMVAFARQFYVDRHEITDDVQEYLLGWSLALGCQALVGGAFAALVPTAMSAFLTGLGALAFLGYQVLQHEQRAAT